MLLDRVCVGHFSVPHGQARYCGYRECLPAPYTLLLLVPPQSIVFPHGILSLLPFCVGHHSERTNFADSVAIDELCRRHLGFRVFRLNGLLVHRGQEVLCWTPDACSHRRWDDREASQPVGAA